jgi:hypothetical protein
VYLSEIVSPIRRNECTKRSIAMPGATGILVPECVDGGSNLYNYVFFFGFEIICLGFFLSDFIILCIPISFSSKHLDIPHGVGSGLNQPQRGFNPV